MMQKKELNLRTVAPGGELLARKELLTLAEVREILGFSKSKLYQERRTGRLRELRFGRVVRVRERDLRRYVERAAKAYGGRS
jgi:excisionase family DNA binding protein